MNVIHFVGGEKGGVGKSVVSRLLSQYFLDQSLPYVGLDADQSHTTLTRYYQDFTRPINLDSFESTDAIMELALEGDQQVLVDLPAQSERFLDRWIDENDVLGLCDEMQVAVVYWYVVDDGRDSAQLLEAFLKKYDGTLNTVVVKNLGRGSDFSEVDAIAATGEERDGSKRRQVTLPALHAETMRKIDKLNFSFWAAANNSQSNMPHLGIMERQRARVWMKKASSMIDSALTQTLSSQS
ncbi:hypothetical protein GCM10011348_20870 [Marinobacterium nitratireducens]|uniref:Mobilization protein MobD n=1 Tax=Marinobacterium nitratireducens TaxID=518897 RepID=A0A917ZDS1_9GAMM|nr:mobilization protein MobD [Marinobacterium nitratireducens]GGO81573.1 hypothetical protein GCM10011348_20870 [Marinobacterium nitratireducens]